MIRSARRLAMKGRGHTLQLDQRSHDRLRWSRVVVRALFGADVSVNVILRASLDYYASHLEQLLKRPPTEDRLLREKLTLSAASRGCTVALPEDQLDATPPLPFSRIERQASDAASRAALEEFRAFLSKPLGEGDEPQ